MKNGICLFASFLPANYHINQRKKALANLKPPLAGCMTLALPSNHPTWSSSSFAYTLFYCVASPHHSQLCNVFLVALSIQNATMTIHVVAV